MAQLIVLLRGEGTGEQRERSLEALREHTPHLEVWAFDPAVDASSRLDALSTSASVCVVGPHGGGSIVDSAVREVLQAAPRADVVLLDVGMAVGAGWDEVLGRAAYGDPVNATASAILSDLLSLKHRSSPPVASSSARGAALGEPLWGCVYVRRDVLDVAMNARATVDDGPANPTRRLEELVLLPGFVHVLAPIVVAAPVGRPRETASAAVTPAVRRLISEVESATEPLRVTIDLRCCIYPLSGTQVHALNLVSSLAALPALDLSVLVPSDVHASVRAHVEALPASVEHLVGDEIAARRAHVFHRPYQLLTENEITDVVSRGTRLVVTHQDMILDRTPAYFPTRGHWRGYTAATALTFVAADEVAFFSEHARQEAVGDGLVDRAKTSVVPPGTNHLDGATGDEARPPRLADVLAPAERPFILVLCNSYFHKNRVFALRVFAELQRSHAWAGGLVFAGGRPPDGSSIDDERIFLAKSPEIADRFADLGRVSDAEQRWLFRHAEIALYPTLYEGFGLIPFETAAVGTPCVYSSRSSVAEYLPSAGALLDLDNVAASAARLAALLESGEARDAVAGSIRAAGEALTWDRAAAAYVEIYRRSITRPVGLALTTGEDVIVGARSQMAATDTERRMLVASRRIPAVRALTEGAVAAALALRRAFRAVSARTPRRR